MGLIIIISVEITGIMWLPKIREFNDDFSELSALSRGRRRRLEHATPRYYPHCSTGSRLYCGLEPKQSTPMTKIRVLFTKSTSKSFFRTTI